MQKEASWVKAQSVGSPAGKEELDSLPVIREKHVKMTQSIRRKGGFVPVLLRSYFVRQSGRETGLRVSLFVC